MAIDSNIPLQVNPPNVTQDALNALKITSDRQQQALYPLQAQSAALDVKAKSLQVQQQQYQMQQQQAMMRAARDASDTLSSSKSSAPTPTPSPDSSSTATPSGTTATPAPAASPTSPDTSLPPALSAAIGAPTTPAGPPLPPGAQGPQVPANRMGSGVNALGPLSGVEPVQAVAPAIAEAAPDLSSPGMPAAPGGQPASPLPGTPTPTTQTTSPQMAGTPTATARLGGAIPQAGQGDWWGEYIANLRKNGVHPQTIMNTVKEYQGMMQNAATLSSEQQKLLEGQLKSYGQTAHAMMELPHDGTRQQYWDSTGRPALLAAGYSQQQLPMQAPADDELRQHVLTSDAFNGVLNNVKSQLSDAAQIMGAATSQADHDQKLKSLQSNPNFTAGVVDNFNHPWTGPETAANDRTIGQLPGEQEKAPMQAAESEQAMRTSDFTKLRNAAYAGRDQYIEALNSMPHGRVTVLTLPDTPDAAHWDSQAFGSQLQSMALTAQQGAQTAYQTRRLQVQQEGVNIRKQIANRQAAGTKQSTIDEFNRQADLRDSLSTKAGDDENTANQIDALLPKIQKGANVFLPGATAATPVADDATAAALKTRLQEESKAARARAQGNRSQVAAIDARNGFTAANSTPAPATPAAPAKPATAPPPPPPPGKTKQTWNIGGQSYAIGDPIKIKGQTYTFQGLDQNGKVQVLQ